MTNTNVYFNQASVYPGLYEGSRAEKEMANELHKTGTRLSIPSMHLQQLPYHYRMEMVIPGFQKENFFIRTDGRVLSVSGIRHIDEKLADHSSSETNCECIIRTVILPVDADTDFATARYNNDTLTISLFTTHRPVENGSSEIIVY